MKTIATIRAASVAIATVLSLAVPVHAAGIKTAGIDHVGVSVPDLKQAEAFFKTTFGCEPVTHIGPFPMAPQAESVKLSMLRCGTGSNIELFEYKQSTGSTTMPKGEDIGASHIAFYTDDVAAGVAYLKSQGIKIVGEPMTMTSGDTAGETWVHFISPWGSELELVGYPHGKGYEKSATIKLWNPKHPSN
jgi:catechol 2,3-dioxygenase-like lactoylglutathione lyase family enzyme